MHNIPFLLQSGALHVPASLPIDQLPYQGHIPVKFPLPVDSNYSFGSTPESQVDHTIASCIAVSVHWRGAVGDDSHSIENGGPLVEDIFRLDLGTFPQLIEGLPT